MPLVSVWARRAVSIPAYGLLLTLTLASLPVWALSLLLVDSLTGDFGQFPRTRAGLFLTWYLLCEAVGVLAAAVIWPWRLAGTERFVDANAAVQRVWADVLFGGALRIFGVKVTVEGAELGRSGPFLMFVRHSSSADTVLAASVIAGPNRILLKYVLKHELLWDPCLDIVGQRLPNAFVKRGPGRSSEDIEAIASLARNLDARKGVLIYPEGTRFTPEKLAKAVARIKEQGNARLTEIASQYEEVLPPKVGGALALIDAAPGVDVLFLDHSGFEGAATFTKFWRGALIGRTLRVRLRRVRASDIPKEHRDVWLFEQWRETDRWVTGKVTQSRAAG